MVIKWNSLLLLSLVFLFSASVHAQRTSVKIAIVTDKTAGLDKSPLVSLLEVQLSQRHGIELLERAEIDKILREQQLSAAGLLERNTTIKIGKLLRTDAFIIFSPESSGIQAEPERPLPLDKFDEEVIPGQKNQPTGQLIRVRVAETAHGLRLLDFFEQLDNTKLDETAAEIAKKVEAVVKKVTLPAGQMIPVGIVDIHRVQLGERHKLLERSLPVLLSVRLSKEPRVIMLEREDLKVLLDEKLLTEGQDSEFWTSAILIDGYLQPNNGILEMNLQLKQGVGGEIVSINVPVEPNEPSHAIDKAAIKIVKQLQDSPPAAKWQPELEAEEFHKQGQLLSNHHRYEEAINLLETAHALQPQNVFYTGSLFTNEKKLRGKIRSTFYKGDEKPHYSNLELAEIVSLYVRQIRDWYERGLLSETDVHMTLAGSLGSWNGSDGYFNRSDSVSTAEIKRINRENRKIWLSVIKKCTEGTSRYAIQRQIGIAWASSDEPEEVFSNLKEVMTKINPDESLSFLNTHFFSPPVYPYSDTNKSTQFRDSADRCWELWLQYIQGFTEDKNPLIKLISCLAMYKYKAPKANDYRQRAIEIFKNELNTPNEPYDDSIKRSIRYTMKHYLTKSEIVEFLKPLVEDEDVANLVLWDPGGGLTKSGYDEQLYQLLEQISQIMQIKKYDKKVSNALNRVIDFKAEIKRRYPQIKTHQNRWSNPVSLLLKKGDWPYKEETRIKGMLTILQDEILWIAFGGLKLKMVSIRLAGIDISKGEPIALWQTNIPNLDSWGQYHSLSGIVINEDITYISYNGGGILEFPGSSNRGFEFIKNPKILTEENGLPSIFITSMEKFDNKYCVAYGNFGQECGLGLYNPETGYLETIFCSTLKSKAPFNNRPLYMIHSLTFVSPDTLFFFVHDTELGKSYLANNEIEGFWKMDTNSREVTYLGTLVVRGSKAVQTEKNTNKIWFKNVRYLAKFNPYTEKITLIMGDPAGVMRKNTVKIEQDLFIPESSIRKFNFGSYRIGKLDLTTASIHNNKLWSRLGESQIIIIEKGKSFEDALIIDNDILDGEPVCRFVSTPYGLIAIGKGTVGLIETGGNNK